VTTETKLQFGRTVWCLTCSGLVHEWLDLGIWSSVLTLVSAILLQYCWSMWPLYLVLTSLGMVPISLVNIPAWSWYWVFFLKFIPTWCLFLGIFQKKSYQPGLGIGFLKKNSYQPGLGIGYFSKKFIPAWSWYWVFFQKKSYLRDPSIVSKFYFCLVWGRYRLGIEIDIKFIQGWYWLVSLLLGLSWYKTSLP